MKKSKYPEDTLSDYLEEEAPEKACISCTHRHFDRSKDHNYCDKDNHYIGYLALWERTCRYHSLEEKRD